MSDIELIEKPPIVMCFSGFDPTGGAGISADIETLSSQGCQPVGVITALTVQDSRDIMAIEPIDPQMIVQQARAVLEDMPVSAFKLGMMGSEDNISAIHSLLIDYPDVPVVFDPVLASGGSGQSIADDIMLDAMLSLLVPQSSVITPNMREVLRLIPEADTATAASMCLLEMGAEYILVTGADEKTPHVNNNLYGENKMIAEYEWPRLPNSYHGSGCTLAACLTGLLAQGMNIEDACMAAQEYTWHSLQEGYRLGMGQHQPNRLYWAVEDHVDESAVKS